MHPVREGEGRTFERVAAGCDGRKDKKAPLHEGWCMPSRTGAWGNYFVSAAASMPAMRPKVHDSVSDSPPM